MKKWQRLSTKVLVDHPRVQVVEDEVKLPNGHVTDYIRFEGDHGAVTLLVEDAGKILLQKEYSYPPDELLYQFPGGGIGRNESPLQAANRELAEETGLSGEMTEIGWFYTDNRRKNAKMHVFVVSSPKETSSEHTKDIEEELEDFWFTKDEIEALISSQELYIYSALAAWALYSNYLVKR